MASLTIRKLDETVKAYLRLRSAGNGRSVEEEVRVILGELIVGAPAPADLMAKMAQGHADDLATAILLAANRPILMAPAMNPLMWNNAATRRNVLQLRRDGIHMIGPNAGEMAEAGEAGVG